MTAHVWVSDLLGNEASIVAKVRATYGPEGRAPDGPDTREPGQPLPSGYAPVRLWDNDDSTEDQHSGYPVNIAQHVPDLFKGCGFWVVTERIAAILQRFDLGDGAVFPISEGLYLSDNATRIPGNYYTWLPGKTKKAAYDPANSVNVRKEDIPGLWDLMPYFPADGDIAVSGVALEGPDVWLDNGLFKSLFLSALLGDALEAAGLKDALFLYRARVV